MGKRSVPAACPPIRHPYPFSQVLISPSGRAAGGALAFRGDQGVFHMTRGGKVLSVMLVVMLGLWGCARGPVGQSGQAERIRTLESQCSKLKDDYHAVAGARD